MRRRVRTRFTLKVSNVSVERCKHASDKPMKLGMYATARRHAAAERNEGVAKQRTSDAAAAKTAAKVVTTAEVK